MQKTKILAAAATAAIALTACNSEPENLNTYDPQAEALKNAAPVEAPPTIETSRIYRCRDNSLVYIDFLSNGTANLRRTEGGIPDAILRTEGGEPPYVAEGYSVSANATSITLTMPGSGTQTCRTR